MIMEKREAKGIWGVRRRRDATVWSMLGRYIGAINPFNYG